VLTIRVVESSTGAVEGGAAGTRSEWRAAEIA